MLETQLSALKERYGDVEAVKLPSGTTLVTVPNVPLPSGWNKASTEVKFLVPPAYPYAPLDCFWTDADLRLADNRLPTNTQAGNPIPEVGAGWLWFSWHLAPGCWNPNRDTLSSWMNSVGDRFRRLQ